MSEYRSLKQVNINQLFPHVTAINNSEMKKNYNSMENK